jgi:hypothetical protein
VLYMEWFDYIKLKLQHWMNPLHIYCRLLDMGLNKKLVIFICRRYNTIYSKWLKKLFEV